MQVLVFTMSIYSNKEKMEGNDYKDICRNHSAKADREMYRICPSKLSKRELEDLYFTLLENNMELKRTINGQNDKIRLLSTQVQRMTNTQEKLVSKDMKDGGTATKAVVDGQKDFISELKDTNKRLSDRIQHLNMRLCSAKQFLKTSPPQTVPPKGNRSAVTATSTTKKHECVMKSPESLPEEVLKVSTYSQWEDKSPGKSQQIFVPIEKKPLISDRPCDENKCRTLMEELKLKIATLQNELFNVHGEYATRIGRLENEVLEVRKENIRVVSERSASELELTETFKRTNDLLAQYRSFEAQCSELTTELAIERRKVAELETQLKAANMSDKVNKTIENHLSTKQETSGTLDGGSRDGGRLEGTPRDAGPKDNIIRDGGPLAVTPRTGFTHDGSSRDGRPQDGSLRDDGSGKYDCGCPPTPPTPPNPPRIVTEKARDAGIRYNILQDGGPLDINPQVGFSRDDGPRIFSPRDGTPRVDGPKDSILQDGVPLDVTPRAGLRRDREPRDGSPRADYPRDGGPRILSLRDGTPRDAGPKDGILQDGGPLDVTPRADLRRHRELRDGSPRADDPRDGGPRIFSPRDGIPRDAGPKDGILQDGGTLDVTPRDRGPRDGGPRDDVSRDGEPRDVGPRDVGPRDGGPRIFSPRDITPRDAGPEDGILQDGGPRDVTPRAGFRRDRGPRDVGPRDGTPRDAGPKDSILKDGGPRDGTPLDAGPKDGILQDGGLLDVTPRAGFRRDRGPRDVGPRDGGPRIFSPRGGSPRDGGPQYSVSRNGSPQDSTPRDDGSWKCHCGCPPTPPIPATPPRVANEKASIKDTNCERCSCKFQLTSAVPSPTPPVQSVPPPVALPNGKCAMSGYNPPDITSTQIKDEKKDVECRCPAWVQNGLLKLSSSHDKKKDVDCRCPAWVHDGLLTLTPSQAINPQCMKCCFKDELKSTGSPPPKTDEGLPPTGGPTACVKDDLNSSNTNDSGYQDTDEQGLLKHNKELMAMILDLQRQIDVMKIGQVCALPGCKPSNPSEMPRIPATTTVNSVTPSVPPLLEELPKVSEVLPEVKQVKLDSPDTEDTAPIHSPSLLGESRQASEVLPEAEQAKLDSLDTKDYTTPVDSPPLLGESPQVEIPEQAIKHANYKSISIPSEDHVYRPRKILRIEVLGNPLNSKASILKQTSEDMQATTIDDTDDTRAKTIEVSDGTLKISDDPVPISDDSELILDKYGYPDLPHREHNRWDSPKFEIVEKKKHERAGITKPDPDKISLKSATSTEPGPGFNPEMFKYLEAEGLTVSPETGITPQEGSLTESIPSNPELGFGIPMLASKASQLNKNKADVELKMLSISNPTLKRTLSEQELHKRQAWLIQHPTQTDDTKKQEDCQYCAACSYDKECADAIHPTINNLAQDAKKHDHDNNLQIPGPIPPLDTMKKEKKRNLFRHFKKHRKENQVKDDLITDPTKYANTTNDMSGGAVTLADVPLLEKRDATDAVEKQLKHDKSSKRRRGNQTKEDLIVNPSLYAQRTSTTTGEPVHLADVAILENRRDKKEQKPPEKSREAHRDSDAAWQGDVSWYRRRSGTYIYRTAPLSQEPLACRCVGRQGDACPKNPTNKDTQVLDNQEKMTPREKRRTGPASDRGTYTLGSKLTDTSADNTDHDYLSDLPSEKEKKSPRKARSLSPGEDRTTTYTSTHSGHSPAYNYSLSEGEMPATTSRPRSHANPDIDMPYLNATLAHKLETPPVQQMEAALQAITDELQRCKNLLQQQRPREVTRISTVV